MNLTCNYEHTEIKGRTTYQWLKLGAKKSNISVQLGVSLSRETAYWKAPASVLLT